MTDWKQIARDAQSKAEADRAAFAAKAAHEREAENARSATFSSAIGTIVVPTIAAVRDAIQGAVHTEFSVLNQPATGCVFKAWNLATVPRGLTIASVPACEFRIEAIERSAKMRFSTSYGQLGVRGASEERDQSQLTQAWLDSVLKTFITNVIAPGH